MHGVASFFGWVTGGRGRNSAAKDGPRNYVKGNPAPENRKVRDDYFKHKREHPEPEKKTPLQHRMQSGGA